MFDEYLARWQLIPDGPPLVTHSSRLLPVRRHGTPAMLKVSIEPDEKAGRVLMLWWDGDGAARVFAHDPDAVLLERAEGTRSLAEMARTGDDDEATRILCAATKWLHAPRDKPLPELVPLDHWFRELWPAADTHGGILALSAAVARELLADQREIGVLHGDIHHDNILDFGARGWLAIDPKRLIGERYFDYANIFCNPDFRSATPPARFQRRLQIVCDCAQLERKRLLQWTLAWAGLSAAWFLGDGMPAEIDFAIAEQATAELRR